MRDDRIDILSHTSGSFIAETRSRFGLNAQTARAIYRNVYRAGINASNEIITCDTAPIGHIHEEVPTRKFTQMFPDGMETESVILPQTNSNGRVRCTLCVSSQVGCAMGCTFCETARMGRRRQLSAREIVGQWFAAQFHFGAQITNIVFMGMGEPMDNLDAVLDAVRILIDHNGAAIAPSRITISTVGIMRGIERLIEVTDNEPNLAPVQLAVSINAPNDAIRNELMPINRAASLAMLMDVMRRWTAERRRRVLIEYVLIPGVNDESAHADELAEYLQPLACTVNIIPYNPRRDSAWPTPAEECVQRFVQRLADRGCFVKRRRTMGRAVMAACGQLGNAEPCQPRQVTLSVT